MQIKEVRIYAENYECALYFNDHLRKAMDQSPIKLLIINKSSLETASSLVSLIRSHKKYDIILTVLIYDKDQKLKEIPVLLCNFIPAIRTDEWQDFETIFWSTYYQLPYLIISPNSVGNNSLSIQDKQYLVQKSHSVLYFIPWESSVTSDRLLMHLKYASCPLYKSEMEKILTTLFEYVLNSKSVVDFYFKYPQNIKLSEPNTYSKIFPPENSNRTKWNPSSNELILKINRFGHGMEPERSGLAFYRMLSNSFDTPFNLIVEFQIQRKTLVGKESYHALFDAVGREKDLMELVENIHSQNQNLITDENALQIFKVATKSQDLFTNLQKNRNEVVLNDDVLRNFLSSSKSVDLKSIFLLCNAIWLTDLNREPIVQLRWNYKVVESYFQEKKIQTSQKLHPLSPIALTQENMKSDLIQYSSVEMFRSFGLRVIENVNLPGFDLDLIAILERSTDYDIILLDIKEDINKFKKDVEKMNELRYHHLIDLQNLTDNTLTSKKNLAKVYIGVAGKYATTVKHYDIDFHILFTLKSNPKMNPSIEWRIELRNSALKKIFSRLQSKYDLEKKIAIANT